LVVPGGRGDGAVIIDAIIEFFLGILSWLIGLMPTFVAPSFFNLDHSATINGYACQGLGCDVYSLVQPVGSLDAWIDLDVVLFVMQAAMTVWLAVTVAKGALWVYDRLPGKAS